MIELAFGVFPDLKNHGVEAIAYPADGTVLMREIRALVQVVRMKENLLRLLETDTTLGFRRRLLLFRASKWNRIVV